ncbi:hypothetical protein [Lacticaseibacillus songhuajiangensis]|uniref:hypothetical protein n=1 Tax=Lacticaseibacillus songhuajiangensis TaxID=1296539 RepID=UPI000F776855|nr:hypothetical protein [Lacticaseibacillus songhuajiangensis]
MSKKDSDIASQVADGVRKQKAREGHAGWIVLLGLVAGVGALVFFNSLLLGIIIFIASIVWARIGYWK